MNTFVITRSSPSPALRRRGRRVVTGLLIAFLASVPKGGAPAQIVTNLVATADTALRSSVPNNNLGGMSFVPVGVSVGEAVVNRGLFQFDLTGIPADAMITTASLRLTVNLASTPPASFRLHRVLRTWNEGTGSTANNGNPAQAGETTWNARMHPGTAWGTPGAQSGTDFAATVSATAILGGTGSTGDFAAANVLADVQAWIANPGTNFGWILIADGEPGSTGKQVGSRESGLGRPTLTLEYTVAAPPMPPNLFAPGRTGDDFHFSFEAESGRTYTVEFRDELTGGDWSVLTNIPALPANTTLTVTTDLTGSDSRFFRVKTP